MASCSSIILNFLTWFSSCCSSRPDEQTRSGTYALSERNITLVKGVRNHPLRHHHAATSNAP
eukprot:COSAG05_NODE_17_length_35518_cov_34.728084_3_plen_62_part_00